MVVISKQQDKQAVQEMDMLVQPEVLAVHNLPQTAQQVQH
jgi:hypothetical protein